MAPSFKERDGLFAVVDCVDWLDFRHKAHTYLAEHSPHKKMFGEYIFRGQSCCSWGLTPSFDRDYRELAPAEADRRYESMMQQFRRAFDTYGDLSAGDVSHLNINSNNLNDGDLEALAQHYGLPTRLLDWSHSLYVAAFFAFSCVDQCDTGLVSVWALDRKALQLFSPDHLMLRLETHKANTRHVFQWGAFVRNRANARNRAGNLDLVELFRAGGTWYNRRHEADYPALIRFDFPKDEIEIALDDLNAMRINAMTIFPGIDGVVRWIRTGATMLR